MKEPARLAASPLSGGKITHVLNRGGLNCAESGRHALGEGRPRTAGLAGDAAGSILSSVALLHVPPGDLRLSQSQQLAVRSLSLVRLQPTGCCYVSHCG